MTFRKLLLVGSVLLLIVVVACGSDDPGAEPTQRPSNTPQPTSTPIPPSPTAVPPTIESTKESTPDDQGKNGDGEGSSGQYLNPIHPPDGKVWDDPDMVIFNIPLDWSPGTPPYTVELWKNGKFVSRITVEDKDQYSYPDQLEDRDDKMDDYEWQVTDANGLTFMQRATFVSFVVQPG